MPSEPELIQNERAAPTEAPGDAEATLGRGAESAAGRPGRPVPPPPPEPVEQDLATASAPVAGDLGRLDAAPAIDPARTAEERARRQALTGRAAALGARGIPAVALSPGQLAWRRLKKNRVAMVGLWLLAFLYGVALFAPFLAPYGYASQDPTASYRPPMRIHFTPWPTVYPVTQGFNEYRERVFVEDRSRPIPLRFFVRGEPYRLLWLIPTDIHLFGAEGVRVTLLGTDKVGRDYLSRLLYASQVSLSVGLIGIAISFTLGLLVGGASGYFGGRVDDIVMRLCEVMMSVPDFYLLLALAATLPPTLSPVLVYILIVAILALVGWAGMARIIRGMVLSVREREYVEAARALGVSDFRIIVRHILPSTMTYAIVAATLSIPGYILAEAGLSFLGLGIRDPMPSWGNMLSDALSLVVLERYPWILAPGGAIFLTTLAFNFLGDGLRDALDPKTR